MKICDLKEFRVNELCTECFESEFDGNSNIIKVYLPDLQAQELSANGKTVFRQSFKLKDNTECRRYFVLVEFNKLKTILQ